jgi:hypothetical protein
MTPTAATTPPTFVRDVIGTAWRIEIDAGLVAEVFDAYAIDLTELVTRHPDEVAASFAAPIDRTRGILWLAVRDQARDEGISEGAFRKLLSVVEDGRLAFMEELTFLFLWELAGWAPGSRYGRVAILNPHLFARKFG